jgi:hypothetical protein
MIHWSFLGYWLLDESHRMVQCENAMGCLQGILEFTAVSSKVVLKNDHTMLTHWKLQAKPNANDLFDGAGDH